jgi:hypothetical protein
MITQSISISGKWLFVDVAENEKDKERLERLARETQYFCKICRKTGLWVFFEKVIKGHTVLVVTLGHSVILTEDESRSLQSACESMIPA